jgi:RES domain-containing protein
LTPLKHIRRHGTYYRVCKPEWADCSDTSYAKRFGGRWTPPEEFGALYLCATIEIAAAVARAHHAGRAIGVFSLRPSRRPQLQSFTVTEGQFVDVVTNEGVAAAGLPSTYPYGADHKACWAVARQAYAAGERGIACRSAAECGPDFWLGEELAVFDNAPMPKSAGRRRSFSQWYPDVVPPLGV